MWFRNAVCFLSFLVIVVSGFGYDGPIAGNKNISDCINGNRQEFSELKITPSEFIIRQGYPAEDHIVVTEDGYILTVNRIPGPPNATVIFLHHGFGVTAFDWVVLGRNKALAFLLADAGYDVWLPNARGSLYSMCHVKYTTSEYSFWNFSFEEIALRDVPAEINYIEKIRGKTEMFFIGQSMGTTVSYVMAIERTDLASKFKMIFSLAPIAFLTHVKGIVPLVAPFAAPAQVVSRYATAGQTFPLFAQEIFCQFCSQNRIIEAICLFFLFPVYGFDFSQVNYTNLPVVFGHLLTPSTFNIANHYSQITISKKFRRYDYGILGNLKTYHSFTPPEYDFSKIQVPFGIFYAENDFLATAKDVKHLRDKIPTVTLFQKVANPAFNHLDFLYGIDAPDLMYYKIISTIKSMKSHG